MFPQYTYYTITSFSIRVPKPIKQALTTMQITQFLVGGGSAFLSLFISYSYPTTLDTIDKAGKHHLHREYKHVPCLDTPGQALAVVFNVVYLTPLTWLFARFFIRSYLGSNANKSAAATKKVRDAGKEAVNGIEKTGFDVEDTSVKLNGNGNGVEQVIKATAANVRQEGQAAAAFARKGWERSTKTAD